MEHFLAQINITESKSGGWTDPAIIAAFIALAGSIVLLIANSVSSNNRAANQAAIEHASRLIERRRLQLDGFLGPLLALNKASFVLHNRLKELYGAAGGELTNFRLLDHLPVPEPRPNWALLVDELLLVGDQSATLLRTSSGLVGEGEWPESFSDFLAHVSILRAAAAGANKQVGVAGSQAIGYYPRQYGEDLVTSYNQVKAELDALEKFAAEELNKRVKLPKKAT
jgi:hypothetical protein